MAIIEIIGKEIGAETRPLPPKNSRVPTSPEQTVRNCPQCGKGSPAKAAFCVTCGAALTATPKMVCSQCGTVAALVAAKFCMKCGAAFAQLEPSSVSVKCPCCSADLPITRDRYEALTGSDIHCFKCNKTFAIPFVDAAHGHSQGHGST